MEQQEQVVVTPEDRAAAAPYMGFAFRRVLNGECDDSDLVQRFARHRLASQQPAREAERVRAVPGEPNWLTALRRWAYPDDRDSAKDAALKKAGRVITQMHADKSWCSSDVDDTLAMIRAALTESASHAG